MFCDYFIILCVYLSNYLTCSVSCVLYTRSVAGGGAAGSAEEAERSGG